MVIFRIVFGIFLQEFFHSFFLVGLMLGFWLALVGPPLCIRLGRGLRLNNLGGGSPLCSCVLGVFHCIRFRLLPLLLHTFVFRAKGRGFALNPVFFWPCFDCTSRVLRSLSNATSVLNGCAFSQHPLCKWACLYACCSGLYTR